jgi:hypothetical protein
MATRLRILGAPILSLVAAACVWFFFGFVLAVIVGLGVGVATLLTVLGESLVGCVVGGSLGFAAALVCGHRELLSHTGEAQAWAWFGAWAITAFSAAGGFFLGMVYSLIRLHWHPHPH